MKLGHVLVIGGGGTGAAVLHDLVLRGFSATLIERGELTSGTTGRHHGQLHSGARYATGDREIARECMDEVRILQKIAPEAIEMNYGLFVALNDEDREFAPEFLSACGEAGIPVRKISPPQALRMESALNPTILAAVQVPDGTLDAWRLPLHFFATARRNGGVILTFTEAIGIHVKNGRITGARVRDYRAMKDYDIDADYIVNAAGAWSGSVAGLAGVYVPVTPAPGTMVAVKGRLTNMVISRLHPPGDGDIIVPQRRLSIIGSTQWQTQSPDGVVPRPEDIAFLTNKAAEMVPAFAQAPFHAAWSAARPLAGVYAGGGTGGQDEQDGQDGRTLSRDFIAIDHGAEGGPAGMVTVIGGKATVLRAMAEKTVNIVCSGFGVEVACETATRPLDPYRSFYGGEVLP